MPSTVVTFERHPRQVLQPQWHPQLLSTPEEKVALLAQTSIDQLVILRFDAAMAALSAYDFMNDILRQKIGVSTLVTGYDNHFGHRTANSDEGFDDYVNYGKELGISVIKGSPFITDRHVRVSSSRIRNFLLEGDVCEAANCLGRPYEIGGTIVSGQHIGTALGFPTANLQPSDNSKLIPAPGAYAVQVRLEDSPEWFGGMMNIGCRPTFGGDHLTLETHIFNFSDNVYDRHLIIRFINRLRAERQFDNREALIEQLAADARQAEEILNQTPHI